MFAKVYIFKQADAKLSSFHSSAKTAGEKRNNFINFCAASFGGGMEHKMKTNVAFFFGGRSVEHEVSIISAQQAMAAANKDKYNVIPIYITKKGLLYTGDDMQNIDAFKDIPALLKKSARIILVNNENGVSIEKYPKPMFGKSLGNIDVAIPVVHGTNGEDGTLQGYLEMLGLPYAGCNILSSAIGMDKILMKKILKEHGIPVLDCEYFYAREWFENKKSIIDNIEKIGYPVIIKPANLGSSVGIKKAADLQELEEAIELATSFSDKILVERAITNLREINCSAMGDSEKIRTSVCEEPFGGDEILSYQDKYMAGSKEGSKGMASLTRKVPADIDKETETKIRTYVAQTFKILCCNGVARVDCMIDADSGEIYVNEINTIPGSLSFYLWEAAGVKFDEIIDELIRLALKRERERQALTFSYDSNLLQLQGGSKGAKK